MKNNFYENHRILNTKKIKYLFNYSNIRNDNNNRDFLSLVKDVGVIKYSERGNAGNKTSDRPEKYKMVDVGDLVINPMNVSIGSVGVSKYSGCLSGVYLVLKPKKDTNSNYYHYVFQDKNFQSFLKTISSGIIHFSLIPFIFICIVTRGLRFFLVAYLTYKFGDKIGPLLDKQGTKWSIIIAGIIVLIVAAIYFLILK